MQQFRNIFRFPGSSTDHAAPEEPPLSEATRKLTTKKTLTQPNVKEHDKASGEIPEQIRPSSDPTKVFTIFVRSTKTWLACKWNPN